jgi:hypothetical protein
MVREQDVRSQTHSHKPFVMSTQTQYGQFEYRVQGSESLSQYFWLGLCANKVIHEGNDVQVYRPQYAATICRVPPPVRETHRQSVYHMRKRLIHENHPPKGMGSSTAEAGVSSISWSAHTTTDIKPPLCIWIHELERRVSTTQPQASQ